MTWQYQFPQKLQYAMSLSNKSPEAIKRVNEWCASRGGSIEHLSYSQVDSEIRKILKKS